MTSDQFCLKWNNYQANIVCALGNLKLDEDFVDVTLSCEGRTIKAHKVILSACSSYFKNVFKENPCQHPVVILKDIRYVDLESLVKYMYAGQVYIKQDQLGRFLKTAEALQVKGLAEHPNISSKVEKDDEDEEEEEEEEELEMKGFIHHQQISFPQSEQQLVTIPPNTMNNFTTPLHLPAFNHPTPPSPSLSPSSSTSSSLPSPGKPVLSPIKVPTPPTPSYSLKRTSFTTLAQYLSGSPAVKSISPPLDCMAKRRKTTPKRYDTNLPAYLQNGNMYQSTSLSASPASPPNSNSTEGGHGSEKDSLEVNEESDMEMAEHSGLTKSPHYGNVAHGSDSNEDKIKLDGDDSNDELVIAEKTDQNHFGETLDLSNRKKDTFFKVNMDSNIVQTSLPLVSPTTSLIHSHIATNAVLEAALKGTERDRSKDRIGDKSELAGSQNFTTLAESLSRQVAISQSNQEASESAPTAPTHPRNRWRCMQPRVCNYCWKTFSNSFNLKQHIVNVHIQSQGVSCNVCDKVVKNKWYLRKHLVTAHGAPLKRSKGATGGTNAEDKVSNTETNDNLEKLKIEINQEELDVVSN